MCKIAAVHIHEEKFSPIKLVRRRHRQHHLSAKDKEYNIVRDSVITIDALLPEKRSQQNPLSGEELQMISSMHGIDLFNFN